MYQKMVFKIPYEPPTSNSPPPPFFKRKKKKINNLITTSLPPQFLSSLPLGLVFVVGSFFLFSFLSFPPFLSISNKILACLRLLLQFLLFSGSPLQIAAPRYIIYLAFPFPFPFLRFPDFPFSFLLDFLVFSGMLLWT